MPDQLIRIGLKFLAAVLTVSTTMIFFKSGMALSNITSFNSSLAKVESRLTEMEGATVLVIKDRVNLRSGPGTDYSIVGLTVNGDTFSVVGRNSTNDWYMIVFESGESAWIYGLLVQVSVPLEDLPIVNYSDKVEGNLRQDVAKPTNEEPFSQPFKNLLPAESTGLINSYGQNLVSLLAKANNFILTREPINTRSILTTPSSLISIALENLWIVFTLVVASIFAIVLKNTYGSTEFGVSIFSRSCYICGTRQNRRRLKRCVSCDELFCYFPTWESPRGKLDQYAIGIGALLGIILTAISILGGIIALAVLFIPYSIIRSFVPARQNPPKYWNQCGDKAIDLNYVRNTNKILYNFRCSNCEEALMPRLENRRVERSIVPTFHSSYSYEAPSRDEEWVASESTSSTPDYSYTEYTDEDRRKDEKWERDHADDDDDKGSIWDGWANKWR